MKKMLFNATYSEELRVAAVEGQKLINFDIETKTKAQRRGNIYKGVITRVESSLEAYFVDYGTEKHGFLPFKETDTSFLADKTKTGITPKLVEGSELIIQIEKDERGNKGAALTNFVSLPGRYLVLMPNTSRAGGISRRIEGDERDELRDLLSQLVCPQGMSVIARTAALGRASEELQWDLDYLLKLWNAIKSAASTQAGGFLIYQESSLVIRSIRDHFSPDVSEILIDVEDVYDQARQFMSHVMPSFVDRIKFYNDDIPLFSRFQIEHQIESAYAREVRLNSGGAIIVDHTEALTAIDVNSGKANKGADIEATALATNLEAAEEVARQMRLRDLGGLVVVDFIDMENPKNQRDVENYFRQQLALDRARIQMGKLSRFGLLELSRQRVQASLGESTTITCPRCQGVGSIRGTESNAVHILRIIEEEIVKNNNTAAFHVQLPVDVATYLLNEKREDVSKIEHRMKVRIVIIPNIHLNSPQYKIRKVSGGEAQDFANRKFSFDLVETPDEEYSDLGANKRSGVDTPKVALNNIPNPPAPVVIKQGLLGVIFKKLKAMFASDAPKASNKRPQKSTNPRSNSRNNPRVSINKSQSRQAAASNANPAAVANSPRGANSNTSRTQQQSGAPVRVNNRTSNPRNAGVNPRNNANATNNSSEGENVATPRSNPNRTRPNNPRNADLALNGSSGSFSGNNVEATPKFTHPVAASNNPVNEIRADLFSNPVTEPVKLNSVSQHNLNKAERDNYFSEKSNTESVKAVPVAPVRPPVIVEEKIDLGELQLVATDSKLVSTMNTSNDNTNLNLKRHNDLPKSEQVQVKVEDYQIVETNK